MSEIETHSGSFKIICRNSEDTKKFIKENLSEWWTIVEYNEGGWDICETTEYYNNYWNKGINFEYEVIPVKDEKWLIKYIKHKQFGEGEDITELSLNKDGSYDFLTQFYNGGTCLSEMIGNIVEEKVIMDD